MANGNEIGVTIKERGIDRTFNIGRFHFTSSNVMWHPKKDDTETEAVTVMLYDHERNPIYFQNVKQVSLKLANGGTSLWVPAEIKKIDKIRIITPPTKLEYVDGEEIDFTGMVVKAFYDDGTPLNDASHPDGVIPIEELELNVTTAINDNPGTLVPTKHIVGANQFNLGNMTVTSYDPSIPINVYQAYTKVGTNSCIGIFISPYFGTFAPRYIGPLLIAENPEDTKIYVNGDIRQTPVSFTYNGATYYYYYDGTPKMNFILYYNYSSILDVVTNIPDQYEKNMDGLLTYIMDSAELTINREAATQYIPVSWTHDEGAGETTFSAQFGIQVS